LSHLKERKQKNCLNCNAQVYGKYCHICGQENLETKESVWHLVTHFINDITHFDGKFFATLRLLIIKPGFLSAEYKRGRRNNYLNPVRMYVFTSFVFFFVFFSTVHIDEKMFEDKNSTSILQAVAMGDSASYAGFNNDIAAMDDPTFRAVSKALNDGRSASRAGFQKSLDSLRQKKRNKYYVPSPVELLRKMDSIRYNHLANAVNDMDSNTVAAFTKAINQGKPMTQAEFFKYRDGARKNTATILGRTYRDRAEYDSLLKSGVVKHGLLKKAIAQKIFELNEKIAISNGKVMGSIFNIVLHNFPQMLFLSLPLFALFLKLIYWRHKDFYVVNHGIYSVHLYIFYFIVLLVMTLLSELGSYMHWNWPNDVSVVLYLLLFFYEYKAMRNFYEQRRAKTLIKFVLAGMARFAIILILFLFFLLFSFLKV